MLHYSALEKIWDKVIGGSIKILAYVAIIKVELSQNVLLGCHTANEAIRCLTKVNRMYIKVLCWSYLRNHLVLKSVTHEKYCTLHTILHFRYPKKILQLLSKQSKRGVRMVDKS